MKGMFDFLFDDDYETRKVDHYETEELIVDTCAANDQPEPYEYETAIRHKRYRDGKWIVVGLYKTKSESILGHKKWIGVMTAKKLPELLVDVSGIVITKMIDMLEKEDETWRIFKRKKEVKVND